MHKVLKTIKNVVTSFPLLSQPRSMPGRFMANCLHRLIMVVQPLRLGRIKKCFI